MQHDPPYLRYSGNVVLGARLADLRQEHWCHPNVRRGGPVSGSSLLVRRFFRLAYPGWQSFPCAPRGRQRRPPISTDSLLERDGFGLPVPSASHETVKPSWERDCCLGKGERIWCGTEGS